jgi:hypothetical protein
MTYKTGFELDLLHLIHLQLRTTVNYSAIAIPTLSSSPLHTHYGSESLLVVSWQRIYHGLTVTSNHT